MRKLATIQKIKNFIPIEGKDKIVLAEFEDIAWKCIVAKTDFSIGDKAVYFEIDSVLPEKTQFEFLRSRCYIEKHGFKGFLIRTMKMGGVISQGLAMPVSTLPFPKLKEYKVGEDVSELIGVVKYDPPEVEDNTPKVAEWIKPFEKIVRKFKFLRFIFAKALGIKKKSSMAWPEFLYKTDETRIQAIPWITDLFTKERKFYISVKCDGSSETISMNKGKFGVYSRNQGTFDSKYWSVVKKYDIEKKLKKLKRNIAIQGELVGPGIQKNKMGLKDFDLMVFNVFDIDKQKFFNFEDMVDFCNMLGLKTVPILEKDISLEGKTVEDIIELSKGNYDNNTVREGIVIRPMKEEFVPKLGRLSFKAINPEFLLKYDL